MDYFNSNFDNDQFDHQENLPEDFGWEEMKDGIYDRMDTNNRPSYRKYWPFLLLLLIAGCGTGGWMAMDFLNQETEQKDYAMEKQSSKKKEEVKTTILDSEIQNENSDKSRINTTTKSPSSSLTNANKPTITKKEITTISSNEEIKNQLNSNNTKKNEIADASEFSTNHTLQIANKTTEEKSTIVPIKTNEKKNLVEENPSVTIKSTQEKLNSIPSLSAEQIEETSTYELPKLKTVKKANPKKQLILSLAGGIMNWAAFDSKNINHDYVSGHPGYSFNPSISLFLKPNHAIQVDYEYASFEELFVYEGSRDITISIQNHPIKHIVNSLTGEVILTERQDVLVDGERKYREVKYNEYKLHTLSVGHRFAKKISRKSSLGVYSGLSFLMRLKSNGKRLDENLDVISFDDNDPLFQKNQLGIRMGFFYDYQLGANTALFSQLMITKYVTNWEVESSNAATRPLLYGIQLGVRRSIGR